MSAPDPSLDAAAQAFLNMDPSLPLDERGRRVAGVQEAEEAPQEGSEEPIEAEADPEAQGEPELAVEGEEGDLEAEQPGVLEYDPAAMVRVPRKDGGFDEVTLGDLYQGGLRQKDYTQKTMELAEQRKAAQATAQAAQQEIDQLTALRTQLAQQVQAHQADPADLEALRQTDPGRWSQIMLEEQERRQLLMQAEQAEMASRQRHFHEQIPVEREKLKASVPEFAKDFEGTYTKTGEYAISHGIPAESWAQMIDHQLITLAWKAMRYDEVARSAGKATRKPSERTRSVRPGVQSNAGEATVRRDQAQLKRLQSTGSVDDAAAVFLNRMERGRQPRR